MWGEDSGFQDSWNFLMASPLCSALKPFLSSLYSLGPLMTLRAAEQSRCSLLPKEPVIRRGYKASVVSIAGDMQIGQGLLKS